MLINTSRGGLIDTKAVIAALKMKYISNLGIDVYEQEEHLFSEICPKLLLRMIPYKD